MGADPQYSQYSMGAVIILIAIPKSHTELAEMLASLEALHISMHFRLICTLRITDMCVAIRAVCYTTDVQEFPEMSGHQLFLVPLRTLEFADKGSSAHSVHVDQLCRCS